MTLGASDPGRDVGAYLPAVSWPVESAAMKASCGTSTRPTIFIRFCPCGL